MNAWIEQFAEKGLGMLRPFDLAQDRHAQHERKHLDHSTSPPFALSLVEG
jgi:hypothetical protein